MIHEKKTTRSSARFYLGREYDLASRTLKEDLILYDSKDLNTHAVIIGMTGSGKTGLGIGILEEAFNRQYSHYCHRPQKEICQICC